MSLCFEKDFGFRCLQIFWFPLFYYLAICLEECLVKTILQIWAGAFVQFFSEWKRSRLAFQWIGCVTVVYLDSTYMLYSQVAFGFSYFFYLCSKKMLCWVMVCLLEGVDLAQKRIMILNVVKWILVILYCCDKIAWPKQFTKVFIWVYGFRELRLGCHYKNRSSVSKRKLKFHVEPKTQNRVARGFKLSKPTPVTMSYRKFPHTVPTGNRMFTYQSLCRTFLIQAITFNFLPPTVLWPYCSPKYI